MYFKYCSIWFEVVELAAACAMLHAVTLSWLAGGSYVDLCFVWGIEVSSFYSDRGVIWPSIEALDEVFQMGLPINDPEFSEQLSKGFYDHSGWILDGHVIAMDGLAV
jgi:hypothetical protein